MPSMLTITLTVSPPRSDVHTCMFYCIYQCNSKTYVFKTTLFMISLLHLVFQEQMYSHKHKDCVCYNGKFAITW